MKSRKIVQNNEFFLITRNIGKGLGIFDDKKVRAYFIDRGINPNTWDGWRRRGRIPANGKVDISKILGVSVLEIKDGTPLAPPSSDENISSGVEEMRSKIEKAREVLIHCQSAMDRMKNVLNEMEKLNSQGSYHPQKEREEVKR